MTPEIPDQAWRAVAIVEIGMILFSGTFLHVAHRTQVPAVLWRAGLAFGWVIGATALALALNLAAGQPLTPGTRVYVVLVLPAAVAATVTTFRVLRRRRR